MHSSQIDNTKKSDKRFQMRKFDILNIRDRIKNGKEFYFKINSTLDEINQLIDNLKQEVNKTEADFSILKTLCVNLISRLPLPVYFLENTFILRSRPNFKGEVFKNESELSYNPFAEKCRLNRFNLEGESAFYGAAPVTGEKSNGALTSICESYKELFDTNSKNASQYITIGKWIVLKQIPVVALTFYDVALQNSEHIKHINPVYNEFIQLTCNEDDNKKCKAFFSFFSEAAGRKADSSNNYLLTTAFYHAIQERYGKLVGIVYSSANTENSGLNIVLTKEILDAKFLKLDHVVMYKCQRNPSDFKDISIFPCSAGSDVTESGEYKLLGII